ncbi:MAG: RidA family protein [Bacteroidota bacterium]
MEEKLAELGLSLPAPPPKGGIYKSVCISGNHLYASGHVPVDFDGNKLEGRVGENMDTATAAKAAELVGLNMLSSIKAELGDLNKLKCLVKTLGMVNCTPDFREHPLVINGFSELMRTLMGPDKGVGARSAVGMMLPHGVPVEIEAIFEIEV